MNIILLGSAFVLDPSTRRDPPVPQAKLAPFPEPTFDAAPILHIISQLEFRTARPTDQHGNPQVPHAYTVRGRPEGNENLYVALWNAIEAHGRDERFGRRKRKYLYPGNGFKYWHMGPLYQSKVINRMKIEDDLARLIREGQVEPPEDDDWLMNTPDPPIA